MANTKRETFSGNMENFYNRPLAKIEVKEGFAPMPASIKFDASYDKLLDIASVREVGEYPSEDDILAFVNNKRKANARQKQMQKEVDDRGGIRPTLLNDDQLKLKQAFDVLMAQTTPDGSKKYTEDEAKAKASIFLGIEWAD